MARRKIHLHGSLKKLAPDGLELEADTVLEALNGMQAVLGMKPNAITGRLAVKVQGFESAEALSAYSDTVDLHVVPVFNGAGLMDIVKIVVGVALIVAAIVMDVVTLGAGISLNSVMFSIGVSLIVGGVANLLFPMHPADTQSNYLGSPGNTTAIGTRISLIFGKKVQVFGQVLSYNIDAVQL